MDVLWPVFRCYHPQMWCCEHFLVYFLALIRTGNGVLDQWAGDASLSGPCQPVALRGCTVCSVPQPHQHHMSGLLGRSHETGSYCACPRLPVNLSILFWPLVSSHMLYSLFFLDVYFIFLLICRLDISVCVHVWAYMHMCVCFLIAAGCKAG